MHFTINILSFGSTPEETLDLMVNSVYKSSLGKPIGSIQKYIFNPFRLISITNR